MKSIAAVFLVLVACGPGARHDVTGADDDQLGVDASSFAPEDCDDGIDNDGDERTDCSDIDCSGVGNCPVCGEVENPQAAPLALPDGVSSGASCTMDSQCGAATPNCVSNECHASYNSTLNFIGFPQGALLSDPSKLLKVCVNMEHSWLRDIQIELVTPDHKVFILDKWYDRTTAQEIYLGQANDSDSSASPVPGVGMDYCWTMSAMYEMINHQNGMVAPTLNGNILAPGDYKSTSPWTDLLGTPLNGMWTMRVTDLWGIDNGYIFHWSISFDPSLVSDCAGPIIL